MSEREQPPEDVVRKLSRVTLQAAERNKRPLFELLTNKNTEEVERLSKEKPIFFEDKRDTETQILLDPEMRGMFPREFFRNPTKWIESQPNIPRIGEGAMLPTGENIDELWKFPYDVSRVKAFPLTKKRKTTMVVSKRLNAADEKEISEIMHARKAFEAGIPTPRVLGEIRDKGNIYAVFEYISAVNLQSARRMLGVMELETNLPIAITEEEFDKEYFQYRETAIKGQARQTLRRFNLSEIEYGQLKALWHTLRTTIRMYMVGYQVIGCILQYQTEGQRKKVTEDILEGLHENFLKKELLAVARLIDENSIEEFLQKIPSVESNTDEMEKKKISATIYQHSEKLEEKMHFLNKQVIRQWQDGVQEILLGFSVNQEKRRLEEQCKKAEIAHKDFSNRNILIEWDFDHHRPSRKKQEKPRLFIIDWEQKLKSPKKEKGE